MLFVSEGCCRRSATLQDLIFFSKIQQVPYCSEVRHTMHTKAATSCNAGIVPC